MGYKITKEYAEEIIKECYSIADFCRMVGWKPQGDNYKIFHKYANDSIIPNFLCILRVRRKCSYSVL